MTMLNKESLFGFKGDGEAEYFAKHLFPEHWRKRKTERMLDRAVREAAAGKMVFVVFSDANAVRLVDPMVRTYVESSGVRFTTASCIGFDDRTMQLFNRSFIPEDAVVLIDHSVVSSNDIFFRQLAVFLGFSEVP